MRDPAAPEDADVKSHLTPACSCQVESVECAGATSCQRNSHEEQWSMQHDRELIALVKAHTPLQTIAEKLDRPITTILKRATKLGLTIDGMAKRKSSI
jgi:hypothetical protein